MQLRLRIENDCNNILTDLTPNLPVSYATEDKQAIQMELTTEQVQWLLSRLKEYEKAIARPGGHHTLYMAL